jgi:hypothetical protein
MATQRTDDDLGTESRHEAGLWIPVAVWWAISVAAPLLFLLEAVTAVVSWVEFWAPNGIDEYVRSIASLASCSISAGLGFLLLSQMPRRAVLQMTVAGDERQTRHGDGSGPLVAVVIAAWLFAAGLLFLFVPVLHAAILACVAAFVIGLATFAYRWRTVGAVGKSLARIEGDLRRAEQSLHEMQGPPTSDPARPR